MANERGIKEIGSGKQGAQGAGKRGDAWVTRHIAGKRNHLGDIPSRSFGYKKEWHFKKDKQFLT